MEKHGMITPEITPDTEEVLAEKRASDSVESAVEALDDDLTKRAAERMETLLE